MPTISPATLALHQQAIIVDGHNDSLVLKLEHGDPPDFAPPNDNYHVDLPRLREGGLTALFSYTGGSNLATSLELWDAMHYHTETYPASFCFARVSEDIRAAKRDGKIALVPQLESCTCLHQSLRALRMQHRLGLRVAGLTHGEGQDREEHALQADSSTFAYGTAAEREEARRKLRGLTDFGRDAVAALNDLGVIIDLAHANDRTFYEALELSRRPCIFSHGCVFAVTPHWRGLTDDQLRALAAGGGVIGIAFYRKFIHQDDPSMDRLMDQLEHALTVAGPDHVGIGSDFDGLPAGETPIPPHVGRLPEVTEAMLQRGFSSETILNIWGGNFLRVISEVWG